MINVYVVSHGAKPPHQYANWIRDSRLITKKKARHKADLFVFTGGADIDPKLYADEMGVYTITDPKRDNFEVNQWKFARKHNIPILGICRGAQLACAMSGGFIIQHVTGHSTDCGGAHPIKCVMPDSDKEPMVSFTTSSHHQMMYPYVLKEQYYDVLAWAEGLSDTYLSGTGPMKNVFHEQAFFKAEVPAPLHQRVMKMVNLGGRDKMSIKKVKEPEVVHFKNTNSLAIQGHPERMNNNMHFKSYCNYLIHDILVKKKKRKKK